MHHIQVKILDKLNHYEYMRFADLRVEGIESNLFTYHLKQLIRDGYVAKDDEGYTLTPQGIFHVDRFSHRLSGIRLQPKIITMIDLRNEKGESLVVRRKYQPFINKVSFPSGKLHLEETVVKSGEREMQEKTGVSNVKLKHVGDSHVIVYREAQLVGQYIIHVLHATCIQNNIDIQHYERTNRWAEPFWADVSKLKSNDCMTGLKDVHKEVGSNKAFFFSEHVYK